MARRLAAIPGIARLDIVGVATSPEYVFTIGPGGPFPADRSFGVFWMGRRGLAAAFDMADAFNDVVATLVTGTPVREACRAIDRELDRYGSLGAFGREAQTSHRYLTNELRELRNMGRAGPVVFLAVTAILMHLVISRLRRCSPSRRPSTVRPCPSGSASRPSSPRPRG